MHCTNGIIIQLPNSSSDFYQSVPYNTPVRRSEPKSRNRKRSFQAIYNDLNHIISKNMKIPDLSLLQSHRIRKIIFKCPGKLTLFGLFFVFSMLLLEIVCQIGLGLIIYLMRKRPMTLANTIGYLPAIDPSTASFEIVAEVLTLSKVIAEALGLTEVDVVLDQAIRQRVI